MQAWCPGHVTELSLHECGLKSYGARHECEIVSFPTVRSKSLLSLHHSSGNRVHISNASRVFRGRDCVDRDRARHLPIKALPWQWSTWSTALRTKSEVISFSWLFSPVQTAMAVSVGCRNARRWPKPFGSRPPCVLARRKSCRVFKEQSLPLLRTKT